jgi:uncharacterized protein YcbK (DUF882 family)
MPTASYLEFVVVVLWTKERFERRPTGAYIGACPGSCSRAEPRASTRRARSCGGLLVLALALVAVWSSAPARAEQSHTARADQVHTVKAGQNLVTIARTHGVTVSSLAARNRLSQDAPLRDGQVLNLPEKGVVYISDGQTLWSIARRHGCSVDALARMNKLTTTSPLKPGMRLRLPGTASTVKDGEAGGLAKTAPASGGKSGGVSKKPGRVDLFRIATSERLSLTLLDTRGRVRPQVPAQLASFLRPRNAPSKQKPPHKRLITLLAEVSNHFGGRRINVASGYRLAKGYTSHQSRHVAGAAIDLRVDGVPNRKLCDYLRQFDDVGVGFYPNSTFVHFDVRDRNAYWIDVSGPGQKPVYLSRADRDGYTGREKTEGLVELGASVAAAMEGISHGEPSEALSDDE